MTRRRKVGVGGEGGRRASQARAHWTCWGERGGGEGAGPLLYRESRGRKGQSEGSRVSRGRLRRALSAGEEEVGEGERREE